MNAKFKEVQSKVMGMIYCNCSLVKTKGAISTYEVLDTLQIENFVKDVKFIVYLNNEEIEVKCTCASFETRGIFCRHAFALYRLHKKDTSLPTKDILDHWWKDLKRKYTLIKSSYDDLCDNPDARRHEYLMRLLCEVASDLSTSEEHYSNMVEHLLGVKEALRDLRPSVNILSADTPASKGKIVLSPNVVRGKERPRTGRRVSTIENCLKRKQSKNDRSGDSNKVKSRRKLEVCKIVSIMFWEIIALVCASIHIVYSLFLVWLVKILPYQVNHNIARPLLILQPLLIEPTRYDHLSILTYFTLFVVRDRYSDTMLFLIQTVFTAQDNP